MQQFTIQAGTANEAFEKMRNLYGEDAVILSHRDVRLGGVMGLFARRGVEITGYTRRRSSLVQGQTGNLPPDELERRKNEILEALRRHSARGRAPALRAPAERSPMGAVPARGARVPDARGAVAEAGAEGGSPDAGRSEAGRVDAIREDANREILAELKEIKSRLEARSETESAPALTELRRILRKNDFTDEYVEELEKRVRASFSLDKLQDGELLFATALTWIGEGIKIHAPLSFRKGSTRTLIVVGPSGVGKTTTIAKLAAKYGLGSRDTSQKNVRIVTIDSYRIGAREQIESYSEIMQIPVSYVETAEELKKVMDLYVKSVDLILIDTIGKSPKDAVNLAKMKKILDGAGHDCDTHLALSASTKAQDIGEILRQFEPFRYTGVILTKLDETSCAGNVISALASRDKGLSYITTGQRVPQDIERASRMRLLMNLEGFVVRRDELQRLYGEERFDEEEWG